MQMLTMGSWLPYDKKIWKSYYNVAKNVIMAVWLHRIPVTVLNKFTVMALGGGGVIELQA